MICKHLILNTLTTLFILLSSVSNVQPQGHLFIPTEFVESIIQSDTLENKHALIKSCYEAFRIISTDEEPEQDHFILLKHRVVDLDSDSISEVLVLFGWFEGSTNLCILKQIDVTWYLIFVTPVWVHNEESEFFTADNTVPNKVFYIRMMYDRGSGIKREGYEFFKLVDGEVRKCCDILTEARIYGWGLYLNQDMEATFALSEKNEDKIRVQYTYKFLAGPVYDSDMSWDSHEEILFVEGKDSIDFVWDYLSYSYQPIFSQKTPGLNELKLASVCTLGDDTLFVKAFSQEIQQRLQNGTDEEKKLLQDYLDLVKANGEALTPHGKMEKKGQIDNTGFWGPNKDSN